MELKRMQQRLVGVVVLVAGLALSPTLLASDRVRGVIMARGSDGSLMVQTDDLSNIVVALEDSTKVRRTEGMQTRRASSASLIPNLRIVAEGRYDSSDHFVARRIRFTRADQRIALAVRPTDERSVANQQWIEQHAQTLQQHSQALQRQSQQLEAQQAEIAANKEHAVATTGALNTRIANLNDFNTVKSITVLFPNNKATLSAKDKAQLQQFAADAKGVDGYAVQIQGFASDVGPNALNQSLSRRRADAVTSVLQQSGIPAANVMVPAAMGVSEQVATNKTAKGQAQNRRAVITLLQNKGIAGQPGQTGQTGQ